MRRMSRVLVFFLSTAFLLVGCNTATKMSDKFSQRKATEHNYFNISEIIKSQNTRVDIRIDVGYNYVKFYVNLGYAVRVVAYYDYNADGFVDRYEIVDWEGATGTVIVNVESQFVWNSLWNSFQKNVGVDRLLPSERYAGKNFQAMVNTDYRAFREKIGMNRIDCAGAPGFSTVWGNFEYPVRDHCLEFYKQYYNAN